jgi:hypothetical protein
MLTHPNTHLTKTSVQQLLRLAGLLAVLCAPSLATVQILSLTPSLKSPQLLGTPVTWTVTATDSNPGPLTFQFNAALPAQSLALVKDFNVGTLAAGAWTSQPFVWVPTMVEGTYKIQVVIKDFASGETTSKTASFQVTPLATGSTPVVVATANPLVALFSAPSCPAGSSMAVRFQPTSRSAPAVTTLFSKCHPPTTMNFEIAGMYPSTEYQMVAETDTAGTFTAGTPVSFKTGALPRSITFPSYTVKTPAGAQTDTAEWVILQNVLEFGATVFPIVATDLSGNIIWYYNPNQSIFLTRPLQNGTMLTIQAGPSWDPALTQLQLLDQIDFAGNIVKQTNIGVLSQQLVPMGATDAALCNTITAVPPPIGAACIDGFHHDAIQTLPNGDTAVLVAIERIFPPGTQGDTTGLPVDIVGDMIVVLNSSWQVIWYFDTFQHATGAPQLDITRPAVLGETCSAGASTDCPPLSLLTSGISPLAKDWLHANALYYWPQDEDIVFSSRNQDWVMKIDYNNGVQSGGLGTGNILWRMGPCGDFTFNNIDNDPWPWFSHQHEPGIENSGAGPLTVFDNGNTRYSKPGASTGCMPGLGTGDSRGMSLTVDESTLTVTPVLSVDLGVQALGDGSAQLLSNGNYSFLASFVFLLSARNYVSYPIEILPTPGTLTGTQVLNILAPLTYRIWRMPSMYAPPIT